jgi:hypothetical protein
VKRLADRVIDSCTFLISLHFIYSHSTFSSGDQIKHLREEILIQRVRYSVVKGDSKREEPDLLAKTVRALEK